MSAHEAIDLKAALQLFRIQSLPPEFFYIPNFISLEEASILQKIPAQRWITLSHRRLQAHPSTLTKNNTLLAAPLPSYLTTPVVDRFKKLGIFDHTPHKAPNHALINEYNRGEGIMLHEDGDAYAEVVATISLGAPICLEIDSKPTSTGGGKERNISDDEWLGRVEEKDQTISLDAKGRESAQKASLPTRILQEPRSLLITTGPAYRDLLHGIAPVDVDENLNAETIANWKLLAEPHVFENAGGRNERGTRVSLTYRDVVKVSSAAIKVLGGLSKR